MLSSAQRLSARAKTWFWVLGIFVGFATINAALTRAADSVAAASTQDPDPDFDRLDGTGKSGKKVHVIEWEGNLEIHVYPKGSLAGLAMKLDDRNKKKPVMVIGYRFTNAPKQQLIRRAILGFPIKEGFHAYQDTSVDDYDKVIVSMNTLADGVIAYKLDPNPKQLYPDGHPALAAAEQEKAKGRGTASAVEPTEEPKEEMEEVPVADDGTIQPFFMSPRKPPYPRTEVK